MLLIFLGVLLLVEVVASEWAWVGVSLIIAFAVNVFECIQAWFTLLCFQTGRIHLEVSLAIPSKVVVVFGFLWTIAFDTSWSLEMTSKCHVPPLLVVLALWDARVYIGTLNWYNKACYIKTSIDNFHSQWAILQIPDIYPNDGHV